MIDPEPSTRSAEARHHLVGDEEDAVAPADLRDRGPVAVRRRHGAERRADERLADEGRDRTGLGSLDRAVELLGELLRRPEGIGPLIARAVRVGRGDMPKPSEPSLIRPAEGLPAAQVERAEGVAVVAAPAREDDPAILLAAREVVRASELDRRLHALGATGDR